MCEFNRMASVTYVRLAGNGGCSGSLCRFNLTVVVRDRPIGDNTGMTSSSVVAISVQDLNDVTVGGLAPVNGQISTVGGDNVVISGKNSSLSLVVVVSPSRDFHTPALTCTFLQEPTSAPCGVIPASSWICGTGAI